ncbi:signal peptidase [Paraburkholderia humisilvae]|uniref:Signal peptidase n=1 Tax=Paraburkholderia humisilvae TaxID=627669 RepID=A0A6J5EIE6_9BURK|nr:signal peptidase [Paraburkholderia humisilvae]CAB3765514.1 hypothetical protein LMG29542_05167 [Paraburkholderia humisilvae]
MKVRSTIGVLAVVAMTQAGCATHVESLPLQAVTSQSAAQTDIALYFGTQAHPEVKRSLGERTQSVHIARKSDGKASCDQALADALQKLRGYAHEHQANAVINISTRFHSTETSSDTNYTCGLSTSAASIIVRGDVVVLEAQ